MKIAFLILLAANCFSIPVISQNVGIGTIAPAFRLDVSGSINTDSVYRIGHSVVLTIKGLNNLFVGRDAGPITTGFENCLSGYEAGFFNTTGSANSFFGYGAGRENSTGNSNSFFGNEAGFHNGTGYSNVAIGVHALRTNLRGSNMVAVGDSALYNQRVIPSGFYFNTAIGSKALYANTVGSSNTACGYSALFNNTTGVANTATGNGSLYNNQDGQANTANGNQALFSNTSGHNNVGLGAGALSSNTIGFLNAAGGSNSLNMNSIGNNNTAFGAFSMPNNISGNTNTAMGVDALFSNVSGNSNTAIGKGALRMNINGSNKVAIGDSALYNDNFTNTSLEEGNTAVGSKAGFYNIGYYNSFFGLKSGYSNSSGHENSFFGNFSGTSNSTGYENCFFGRSAGELNVSGFYNCFIGNYAGRKTTNGANNSFYGRSSGFSNLTGDNNTIIGSQADVSAGNFNNSIVIGYSAEGTAGNQARIGNASVISIGGFAGWSNISDGRFKKDIRENVIGLDFILQLRPVTYTLNIPSINEVLYAGKENKLLNEKDIEAIEYKSSVRYTGFVAQEVEATAQSLAYDFSGVDAPRNEKDLYALRYAEFVVPLVKAVQEQQVQIDQLKKENEEIKKLLQLQQKTRL